VTAQSEPDLSIFLAAGDEAHFVCVAPESGRRQSGRLYVLLHRSNGGWTHVYRVVDEARSGRTSFHVEHVLPGARLDEARAWALATFLGPAARAGSQAATWVRPQS
jgi:hypothetical protein